MRRIMIVGSPGAGKSTVAQALGRALGLPVHHLDRMWWRADWRPVPDCDRHAALQRVLNSDAYVLEGAHPDSFPARIADCDTLLWLDLNILLRFCRVCRRMRRSWTTSRPDLPEGCTEGHLRHALSFWRHFWYGRKALRQAVQAIADPAPAGVRVVHLTSVRAVRRFLDQHGAQARIIGPDGSTG